MAHDTKPAFELILSGLESAPENAPFDPAQVKLLEGLYKAAQERYAQILDAMLSVEPGTTGLSVAVVQGAQMLYRRIANALAQAALRLGSRPHLAAEQDLVKQLALHSLRARAEEIKWHAFERTFPPATSWGHANTLFAAIESLGFERQQLAEGGTCTDAFAQCILLSTLSVGILSAPQMELAHRWLSVAGWGLRIEPFFDPNMHWYQINIAQSRGPERISPASAVSDTTRFIAVRALAPALALARAKLYSGELGVPATPNRVAALHFGAFLDLAERLWSPDWRRAAWRSPRMDAHGESVDVVIGFDQIVTALGEEDDAESALKKHTRWMLRDKSDTGLGVLLPEDSGAAMQPGTLIAYRPSVADAWQLGSVVRRMHATDDACWVAGVKRISDAPVRLDLKLHAQQLQPQADRQRTAAAIYAPMHANGGRADGLVVDAKEFAQGTECELAMSSGVFRIKLNRIIERGDTWQRVGFEVLGKQ